MVFSILSLAEPARSVFERFFFGDGEPLGLFVSLLYGAAIVLFAIVPFVLGLAMIAIWAERKVAGHMQSRLGPNRVGPFGLLQSLADGIKLILKEDLIPGDADRVLFRLAPYVAFAPVFAAFLALPFGPDMIFERHLNSGLFLILAMLSVEAMGVILAGWSSNNKWSVYGAMREACQMISYEIPLGISLIVGVMTVGTLNLADMGRVQGGGLHTWLIFQNPFIFVAFFVYFTASLASNKRAPFDLPESESELVAGYLTEYSGMRWAFFFFAEYAAMFIVGGIQVVLFLGAWHDPFGLIGKYHAQFTQYDNVPGLIIVNLIGAGIFVAKASIIVFVQMWLRWTLPRPRIDQVLYACVKVLLPLACVLLLGAALWELFIPSGFGIPWVDYHPFSWIGLTHAVTDHKGNFIAQASALGVGVQLALTLVGLGLFLAILGWIGYAFVTGRSIRKRLTEPEEIVTGEPAAG